jgi:hypothetical protein
MNDLESFKGSPTNPTPNAVAPSTLALRGPTRRYLPTGALLLVLYGLVQLRTESDFSDLLWQQLLNSSDRASYKPFIDATIIAVVAILVIRYIFTRQRQRKRLKKAGFLRREYGRLAADPAQHPSASEIEVPSAAEWPITKKRYRFLIYMRRAWLALFLIMSIVTVVVVVGFLFIHLFISPAPLNPLILLALASFQLLLIAGAFAFSVRNRAMRILLLRPFQERGMTAVLKRFVRRNLGQKAYVFTLADRDYRPSLIDSLLFRAIGSGVEGLLKLFLSPIFAHSHRLATVTNDRTYRRLAMRLLQLQVLSFWSFISRGQAFNVRSDDNWWKMCVRMMMHSCEIIVVDLSRVKEGSAWELAELHRCRLLQKCIFVASEREKSELQQVLTLHFDPGPVPLVHVYRDNGKPVEWGVFDSYLTELIDAGLKKWH